jgi:predicted hydrocarbon binding protein
VENSPFAHGYGASPQAVCAPIAGMFAAAASIVCNTPMQVEEDLCAAAGAALCRFSARARRP